MNYKLKIYVYFIILLLALIASGITVYASKVTTTSASIEVSLIKDDGKTSFTSPVSLTVKNAAEEALISGNDYKINVNSPAGVYTITNLIYKQPYYLTFSTGTTSIFICVPITEYGTQKIKLKWVDKDNFDQKKSGLITGYVIDANGRPASGITVKAASKDATYITTSASTTGAYKIYCPSGTYLTSVITKDSTKYKNVSLQLNVIAGQAIGPLFDMCSETEWGLNGDSFENTLGFGLDTELNVDSKLIEGHVNVDCSVTAFIYGNNNAPDFYYLGSFLTNSKSPNYNGTEKVFKIKLSDNLADKKLMVRVKDTSGNVYDDYTYGKTSFESLNADATEDVNATLGTPITIKISDKAGLLYKNITSITAVSTASSNSLVPTPSAVVVNLKSQQYKVYSNKIVINQGVLNKATTYNIIIKATGYNDTTVLQLLSGSSTLASALKGTFTISKGTSDDTVKISTTATAGTGDILVYRLAVSDQQDIFKGDELDDFKIFNSGNEISGLNDCYFSCYGSILWNPENKIYIDIVEITTPASNVVKLSRLSIPATAIKPPGVTSKTSGDYWINIYTDSFCYLDNPNTPDKKAFTVMVNGKKDVVDDIYVDQIYGRCISIALHDKIPSTASSVTISYAKPSKNYIMGWSGNALASFATSNILLKSATSSATYVSICTTSGNSIRIVMNAPVTEEGTLKSAFKLYKNLYTPVTIKDVNISGGKNIDITLADDSKLEDGEFYTFFYIPDSSGYLKFEDNIVEGFYGYFRN